MGEMKYDYSNGKYSEQDGDSCASGIGLCADSSKV